MKKITPRRLFVFIVIILFFLPGCFGPVIPVSNLPPAKILDMHCHTAGIGAGGSGCFVSDELTQSYKFEIYLNAFDTTLDEIKANGDAIILKKIADKLADSQYVSDAVILALDGVIDESGNLDRKRTELYVPGSFVVKEIKKYPGLHYGASINPHRPNALQLLEEAKRDGAVLLKWLPSIQLIDMSDTKLIPFYQKLKELELPLLTHTGDENSFTKAENKYGDPLRLELPLSLGVTVIAAHVATTGESQGHDNFERIMPLFKKYDNLYGDISSLTQINKIGYLPKILKRPYLHKKLLYGSDLPLIETALVSPFYYPLNLNLIQMFKLSLISNSWDEDVLTKQSLGLPAEIFQNARDLLNVPESSK